ncbi:SpaA isopeptide-forming pilin-related protein [Streptomyces sp. NPDC002054]|uniref:SpaA isopeptide-forming pilin-related protein n=1 Tax=Streptomyces sp. NPDC002054 TaxID=3154663 RepID=UPI003332C625
MTARSSRRARRSWVAGMALGALLVGAMPAVAAPGSGEPAPRGATRAAAPLPNGLGPCIGPECPAVYPGINDGPFAGRDRNINTFVGQHFQVRGTAAAAEGRAVALGDFNQNKSVGGSSGYHLGIVPVGSRVPPPDGSDFLSAGGNVTVAGGQSLITDDGVVRYAGTLTGNVTGPTENDPNAVTPYTAFRASISAFSQCYARPGGVLRTATGSVSSSPAETLFTGDGTSPLQVFNIDADMIGTGGVPQGTRFTNIPAGATILVNVLGTTRTINSFSGTYNELDPFNRLRNRLLWNYPDATTLNLRGNGEFQGSHLIGQANSLTTVTTTGLSGRLYTAGSLTHGSADRGFGQEIHSYPFTGDLPDDCAAPERTGTAGVRKLVGATPLANAVFELWRETNGVPGLQPTDTKWDGDCVTAADGRCLRTVPADDYYWVETQAPPGYNAVTTVTPVTVTPGIGVTVDVQNIRNRDQLGRVSVLKRDAVDQAPLSGATFELWQESGAQAGLQTSGPNIDVKIGGDCVTDAAGICTREVVLGNTYYWFETQVPFGHLLPADPVFPLTVTVTNPEAQAIADNPRDPQPTGPVTIAKRDTASGSPLEGARFELWRDSNGNPGLQTTGPNADTRVGPVCITPAAGFCTVTAPIGRYFWVETQAPPGYQLPADRVFGPLFLTPVNALTGGVRAIVDNPPVTGPVSVVKTNGAGNPLAGATFELWRETNDEPGLQTDGSDPDTQVGGSCTTPANGTCTRTVPVGTYYWVETQTPAGFEPPANPVFGPLELTVENADIGVTERVINVPTPRGRVSVTKTDPKEKPLSGAVFELWREANGIEGLQTTGINPDIKVSECTTAKDGICARDVERGTYYWRETQAPNGYLLPKEPVFGPLELTDENLETGVTAVAVNKKEKPAFSGSIRVLKKDAGTGRPLAGAVFELWRETNGVRGLQTQGSNPDRKAARSCRTDRQGVCAWDGLAAGAYYVRETAAPRGYVKPRHPVTGPLQLGGNNRTSGHNLVVKVKNIRSSGTGGNGTGGNGHGKGHPKAKAKAKHKPNKTARA